jgi:NAD(P)-dependent dehydrogenase (short-subunit alcohol dehydrogenase family)
MKTILITGAGRGIGLATAKLLRARGHRVLDASRSTPDTDDSVTLDVTSNDSVSRGVARVIAQTGGIDVLINNAGYDLYGAFEDTTPGEFDAQIETNFNGVVRMTRALVPHMRARGHGRIVNISSLGGLIALPFNGAYAASKFALEGLSESLRYELLPANIFVSLIEAGQVNTDTLAQSVRTTQRTRSVLGFETALLGVRAREAGAKASLMPSQVAAAVVSVIETNRPRLRYRVGKQTHTLMLLRALLPERTFESIVFGQFVRPLLPAQDEGVNATD